MKILVATGRFNYGDPTRGEGYEYTNFLPALRSLGHEVSLFDIWDRSAYPGFVALNRAFLQRVAEWRPDVVLAVPCQYEIWLDTWEALRDSRVVTILWSTDDPWKYAQFSRLIGPAFDIVVTTCPSFRSRYVHDGMRRAVVSQWAAASSSLCPPRPAARCSYDVSFVGTAHGERRQWIEWLRAHGIEVACFGHGWPCGPIVASEIPKIIGASRISLNFANSVTEWRGLYPRRKNQVKARTFEVPGAGGFLLTQVAEGLERYFELGREVAAFSGREDLAEKIRYYLSNPAERDGIAGRGFERTRSEHTYEKRFAEILECAREVSESKGGSTRSGPIVDAGRLDPAIKSHAQSRSLSSLKALLVGSCAVIWGRSRAERAARRLVFEMDWRLAGRHAYRSAGWAGRLFYL